MAGAAEHTGYARSDYLVEQQLAMADLDWSSRVPALIVAWAQALALFPLPIRRLKILLLQSNYTLKSVYNSPF
jgi:hypothetical protein